MLLRVDGVDARDDGIRDAGIELVLPPGGPDAEPGPGTAGATTVVSHRAEIAHLVDIGAV